MKAVLDTNVLIDFFRNPNHKEEFEAKTLRPQFFMSSVVAMELFAGCRTKRQQSELKSFLKPFEKAKRVIAPDHSAFLEAGIVLARLGAQGVDVVRRRQLVNDIPIAVTAARDGTVVIPGNAQVFSLIKVCAQVRWMLPADFSIGDREIRSLAGGPQSRRRI